LGRKRKALSLKKPSSINTKAVKEFANELPESHPLRIILLSEENEIPTADFLVKIPIWLKLARLQGR
jgi:hypothetical protein